MKSSRSLAQTHSRGDRQRLRLRRCRTSGPDQRSRLHVRRPFSLIQRMFQPLLRKACHYWKRLVTKCTPAAASNPAKPRSIRSTPTSFMSSIGSAMLVTGGKAIDTKEIAPHEIRGTKIEGGQVHQITKGEVIIIPNGVPHQFTAVTGELHYFVCKPTALAEGHLTGAKPLSR